MKNKYLEFGIVPSNFDVDIIFENVDGNKTLKKNLKEGAIYLISLITRNNYNELNFDNGYRHLKESILSDVIGRGKNDKRLITIVHLLTEKNVIETKNYRIGHYSTGYRLKDKFNNGEYKSVEFSDRIKKKLLENANKNISKNDDKFYLYAQFKNNDLTVEYDTAIKFIKKLGLILLEKTLKITNQKNRDFTLESLLHYFGRMDNILIDLKDKHYNLSISGSNQRFNSNLTSLPKMLRTFLRINNEQIGEVDISSSQPYILSTILNRDFTDSTEKGYNIRTIYPELLENFDKLKYINLSKQRGDETNQILGIFFNDEKFNNLNNFTEFDFKSDFYQNIISEGTNNFSQHESTKRVQQRGRNYVKSKMMNYLFDRNDDVRNQNDVINLINRIYPSLSYFIEYFLQMYGQRDFALLLQRTEAYLMLNNVCKNLSESKPEIPFFTIHDSIITTVSNLTVVKEIMIETITKITGKTVNVKEKEIKESNPEDWVDEKWNKIQIKSEKSYQKIKPSFLQINTNKGIKLLTTGNQEEDILLNKFYKNFS